MLFKASEPMGFRHKTLPKKMGEGIETEGRNLWVGDKRFVLNTGANFIRGPIKQILFLENKP